MRNTRKRRRQLDKYFSTFPEFANPQKGWIYSIRNALGMTLDQLAKRVGVTKAAVQQLETREIEQKISLQKLAAIADQLDCDLVYSLVPRRSLDITVKDQAYKKATDIIDQTNTSMAIEKQGLSKQHLQEKIDDLVEEMLFSSDKRIWDE